MSTIHFKKTTTATPEQFIAGLTDFGPGRGKIFGNSTDEYLKVHKEGSTYADVTEGSGGIWERLNYNWSDPTHIVLTTTDSNLWGGRSQGAVARRLSWARRQGTVGESVRQEPESDRGTQLRRGHSNDRINDSP